MPKVGVTGSESINLRGSQEVPFDELNEKNQIERLRRHLLILTYHLNDMTLKLDALMRHQHLEGKLVTEISSKPQILNRMGTHLIE